jgi:hypothetical protein
VSDETPDETRDETAQPSRRPSPTSRARRIGGRPSPQPASRPSPGPVDEAESGRPKPSLTKTGVGPKPAAGAAPETAATSESQPPTETEPEAGDGKRAGWQRWIPAGILAVAAVVLLALLVVASHGVYWAKPDDSAGARTAKQEQVLAAAKKCFATVNTYDYRKVDGLVAKDLPCTTGKFKTDLKEALQKTIIPQAPKTKAVQSAQVNRAGVISVDSAGTQVVTLIYGQLVVTNSTTAKTTPRTDLFGAVVTMNRVGSDWLISKVGFDAGNGLGG